MRIATSPNPIVASENARMRSRSVSAGAKPSVRSEEPLRKNASDHPPF